MQRFSSLLSAWDRKSSSSESSSPSKHHPPTPALYIPPILSNASSSSPSSALKSPRSATPIAKIAREAFWPGNLEDECNKAARILNSFCADGFASAPDSSRPNTPNTKQSASSRTSLSSQHVSVKPARGRSNTTTFIPSPIQSIQKIPKRVIQNAAGIAVFTCMRSGLWMTGSGGSGILIARKADGTWSPPSALLLHTPSLSFILNVDVYDCVIVVNSQTTLEALMQSRVVLGEEIHLAPGPLVPLGLEDVEIPWKELGDSVFTYLKSRGQSQDVDLRGCILTERVNENVRFYGPNASVFNILAGQVNGRNITQETRALYEVIKQAEGRTDYDEAVVNRIAVDPSPSDAIIDSPQSFTESTLSAAATPISGVRSPTSPGRPDPNDPDPFGLLALEMAGMEIREVGASKNASSSSLHDQTPISPLSARFPRFSHRMSRDTLATASSPLSSSPHRNRSGSTAYSRRTSGRPLSPDTQSVSSAGARSSGYPMSTSNVSQTTATTEVSASTSTSSTPTDKESDQYKRQKEEAEEEEVDYTKVDLSPLHELASKLALYHPDFTREQTPVTKNEDTVTPAEKSTPATSSPPPTTLTVTTTALTSPDVSLDQTASNDGESTISSQASTKASYSSIDVTAPVSPITESYTPKVEQNAVMEGPSVQKEAIDDDDDDDDDDEEEDDDEDEDSSEGESDEDEDDHVVIVRPSTQPKLVSTANVITAKGSIITIPKRIPPPLPVRSPARALSGDFSDRDEVGRRLQEISQASFGPQHRPTRSQDVISLSRSRDQAMTPSPPPPPPSGPASSSSSSTTGGVPPISMHRRVASQGDYQSSMRTISATLSASLKENASAPRSFTP